MEKLKIYRQSDLLYTQESILRYRKGGYHPVCLGDSFQNDRYRIQHKLGWGGFSTVWLAEDTTRMRWVSIKIMTADTTAYSHELSILESLAKSCKGSLDSRYIVQLLDEFSHQGPNGTHQCLVFELLGPTLDMVTSDYSDYDDREERLEPDTVLRISEQLLNAIAFVHEAGYGHGDVSSRNIAFTCSHLSQSTKKDLFDLLGGPETEELARLDGKPLEDSLPKQLVNTAGWNNWTDEDEEDLRIIDFGEAFLQGAEPTGLAQPNTLRAPETIFTSRVDCRIDLWRAGIAIYSCVVGGLPFHYWGNMNALVAQMIDFVGALPTEWQPKWHDILAASNFVPTKSTSLLKAWFVDPEWVIQMDQSKIYLLKMADKNPSDEADVRADESHLSKLERRLNEKVPEESLKLLLPVIQGLMRFMPSDRISASQALDLVKALRQNLADEATLSD